MKRVITTERVVKEQKEVDVTTEVKLGFGSSPFVIVEFKGEGIAFAQAYGPSRWTPDSMFYIATVLLGVPDRADDLNTKVYVQMYHPTLESAIQAVMKGLNVEAAY